MTIQAKPKSNQIIEEIRQIIDGRIAPDEMRLARLKREANEVKQNVNRADGLALLGMIACLKSDAEGCQRQFDLAMQCGSDVVHCMNYARSMLFLNQPEKAQVIIKSFMKAFKSNPEFLDVAMNVAIESGNISQVEKLYDERKKLIPDEDSCSDSWRMRNLARKFVMLGVSDLVARKLLKIAADILDQAAVISKRKEISVDDHNPDGDLFYWIMVNAQPSDVVDLNVELCEKLAADPSLNFENTFSIVFRSA